jgi:hypothetical protein
MRTTRDVAPLKFGVPPKSTRVAVGMVSLLEAIHLSLEIASDVLATCSSLAFYISFLFFWSIVEPHYTGSQKEQTSSNYYKDTTVRFFHSSRGMKAP